MPLWAKANAWHQPSPPARGKCRRRVAKDLGRYRRRTTAGVCSGRGKRAALPREPPRSSGDLTRVVLDGCDCARVDGSGLQAAFRSIPAREGPTVRILFNLPLVLSMATAPTQFLRYRIS